MRDHHYRMGIASTALLSVSMAAIATISHARPALAGEDCNFRLGNSVAGSPMAVDLCSLRPVPRSFNVEFTYSIEGVQINANANCRDNSWYIPSDDTRHVPRSRATENMLKIICTAPRDASSDSRLAVIFNPPSNIRRSPNGPIICTVTELRTISTSSAIPSGWIRAYVPGCGGGYIHKSQVAFN